MYVGGGGWNSSELIMSPMVMCVFGGSHRAGGGGDRRSGGGRFREVGRKMCCVVCAVQEFDTRNLSPLLWPLLNNVLAGECYCRATSTGGERRQYAAVMVGWSWWAKDMTESRHDIQSASPPHVLKHLACFCKRRSQRSRVRCTS